MAVTIAPFDALQVLSITRQVPQHQLYVDYDETADVLYVSFSEPPALDADCIEDDDGIITRFDSGGAVIGYTYLNASELLAQSRAA